MKKILLLAFIFLLPSIVSANHIVFSCKTENNKYIEVRKINKNTYEYNFGSTSKNELSFQNKKSELLGRSKRWEGLGRGRWAAMSFQRGEYIYDVWVNFDSIEHTTESGVNVERRGKSIATVYCTQATAVSNFNDEDFAW